jgi:hypothetical protein
MLEAAIGRHAWRLRDVTAPSTDQLRQILPEDLSDEEPTEPAEPKQPAEPVEPEQSVEPEQEEQA